jgi:replication-associated recombination protein RarA
MDGNKQEGIVLEEIARVLKLNKSNAPKRPPRIILLGPPGCGKTGIALKIA